MKRVAVAVLLLVVGVVAVDFLGDLTQTRSDPMPKGSRSEVTFDVAQRRYKGNLDDGARSLVAACAGSVSSRIVGDPGVVEVSPGRFSFMVEPALGRYNHRKLEGCLEDFTLDHLRAGVVSVNYLAP